MELVLPLKVILSKICIQYAYFDLQSEDKKTSNKTKPKYKVCCDILPIKGVYAFFVATSDKPGQYKYIDDTHAFMVKVEEHQWEDRDINHLKGVGYINTNIEVHSTEDLISKIQDNNNGFKVVAHLCDERFLLAEEKRRINSRRTSTPAQIARNQLFDPERIQSLDELISRLGLK